MEHIDMETWNRKEYFRLFQQMDISQINICANVDVTKYLAYAKHNRLPFYYAMIYASLRVANRIENFRYRIRDGQVVRHEEIHPAFTALSDNEDDLFKLVTVATGEGLPEFAAACATKLAGQPAASLQEVKGRDDLVFISCIPWISFTQLTHTTSLNKNDSIPRLAWGKYFAADGKVLMPYSVQVHHGLADGIHIGRFFTGLQAELDQA